MKIYKYHVGFRDDSVYYVLASSRKSAAEKLSKHLNKEVPVENIKVYEHDILYVDDVE